MLTFLWTVDALLVFLSFYGALRSHDVGVLLSWALSVAALVAIHAGVRRLVRGMPRAEWISGLVFFNEVLLYLGAFDWLQHRDVGLLATMGLSLSLSLALRVVLRRLLPSESYAAARAGW